MQGCSLPQDHEGLHWLRPAHHLIWEAVNNVLEPGRVRMLPKGLVLRPKDGDWLNLDVDNWEVTTPARINKALHSRDLGTIHRNDGWYKVCVSCDNSMRGELFERHRNICKECHKKSLQKNTQNWREHTEKFGCRMVNGRHYHLGKLGSGANVKVYNLYLMDLFFTRLRDKVSSERQLKIERLNHALGVESDMGDDNDSKGI